MGEPEVGGDLNHLSRSTARRRIAELLERFELAGAAAKPELTYSGGMRRRLDLAMTLLGQPRVIEFEQISKVAVAAIPLAGSEIGFKAQGAVSEHAGRRLGEPGHPWLHVRMEIRLRSTPKRSGEPVTAVDGNGDRLRVDDVEDPGQIPGDGRSLSEGMT